MRDLLLVARFEILRAIRTWRAIALIVLFCVASGGATYVFTRFVGVLENTLADQMGVPRTETPGAMLEKLVASDSYRNVVEGMVGAADLVDYLLAVPPLAMFSLWFGFLLVPFFAASASAECIAIDVQNRAIRYEATRTGRLEIVMGRFAGQLSLTLLAQLAATTVVFGVGIGFMVINRPLELAAWLAWFSIRAWFFAIPFIGIGVAASQLTASPAWARVLAVGATAGSWVLYGLARFWEDHDRNEWLVAILLQVLPQGWLYGMWQPQFAWLLPALATTLMGLAFAAVGYLRFMRKDL